MITKEQLEAGCDIWLVYKGEVLFSRYNLDKFKHERLAVLKPEYHTSRYEAELYLLECRLNDN